MKTFALIGKHLAHSFSQIYFTQKFETLALDAQFINLPMPSITELPVHIEENPELEAFSVTIPYKEEIIPYLHELSPQAQAIGAVNSVRIYRGTQGTRLHGYNTDCIGFQNSFTPLLSPHHQNALVLGSGGAARAVVYVLSQLGITYRVVSRTPKSAEQIAYSELAKLLPHYQIIINTTPLGTFPEVERCPPIPYDLLDEQHYLFDLVYNPSTTLFLSKGLHRGAKIKNGLEMLHLQAEASWQIWNR